MYLPTELRTVLDIYRGAMDDMWNATNMPEYLGARIVLGDIIRAIDYSAQECVMLSDNPDYLCGV